MLMTAALVCAASCTGGSYGGGGGNGGGGGGGGTSIPTAPSGLTATAGNAQVSLSWSASTGATGYYVKRGTASGGPYTQVAATASTSSTDMGLTNGTTYYYVVTAYNGAGESGNSNQASATPSAPAQAPAAPTGLAATAGNAQVSLTWNASTGATSYHVKRATTSGGPYTTIATLGKNKVTYTDSDPALTYTTTYYYVVQSTFLAWTGDSAEVAVTTLNNNCA